MDVAPLRLLEFLKYAALNPANLVFVVSPNDNGTQDEPLG